ncbi:glycosyltransferase [candidate division WOR-3 bacterium]|nr:glycosyltransferase [candidate division WOR-3 bacterium]
MIGQRAGQDRICRAVQKVVIGGIGTGGHYFPAAVTAVELERRGFEVCFLVRRGYQEESVARRYGLEVFSIRSRPFYGRSLIEKLLVVPALLQSVLKLNHLIRRSIGLGFGGFGSVPLCISCLMKRRPFYIFEPNRVPGRATRFFASRARRVFLGMPVVSPLRGRVLLTGIPIRHEFKSAKVTPAHNAGRRSVEILFYGGSQGARRLNDLALELQGSMPEDWQLTVIAGTRDYERVNRLKNARTRVVQFSERPWQDIGRADIVISRAGALAGYEIMILNKKVIFIPFPYAVDAHQRHNASYFAKVGRALVCAEDGLTAQQIRQAIDELLKTKSLKRTELARNAEKVIAGCLAKDIGNEEI